eukprot:11186197-Heterocapsa_arctica.AAC.1
MSSLLPMVVADLRRPWNSELHMTDAAPHGHCTCTKQSDPGTIRSLAAWSEKWRYRRLLPSEWQPRA